MLSEAGRCEAVLEEATEARFERSGRGRSNRQGRDFEYSRHTHTGVSRLLESVEFILVIASLRGAKAYACAMTLLVSSTANFSGYSSPSFLLRPRATLHDIACLAADFSHAWRAHARCDCDRHQHHPTSWPSLLNPPLYAGESGKEERRSGLGPIMPSRNMLALMPYHLFGEGKE